MKQELRRITLDEVEVPVALNSADGQFEIAARGALALLEFRRHGRLLALVHTEVPPALRGARVADRLAETALDYARAEQLQVEPYCPFVAAFIKRHEQYADLVSPTFAGDR